MVDYHKDWDLSTIPHELFYRESARRRSTAPRPGRRVMRECPYCGLEFSTVELIGHKPVCPENPRVQRILAAQHPAEPAPQPKKQKPAKKKKGKR
jgi:hypothetical protein